MAVRWSEKLEDRFSAAFAIPGFYKSSTHIGDAGIPLKRYFDFDLTFRDPAFCRLVVELLSQKVKAWTAKTRVDYTAFLEKRANTTGALTLAGAVTINTGIPHLIVRLRKDIPYERIKFPRQAGETPLENNNVVLITDYATTGRELQPAVRVVQGLGGNVVAVIVLVWNDELFNKNGEMDEVGVSNGMITTIIPASQAEQIAEESAEALGAILAVR